MANVSFTYRQDADTVFRFASDPDAVKKRCETLGDTGVQMETSESGGTKTVKSTREVEMDIPGFAKKLFKARNTIVEVKQWTDHGDRKTGHFSVDVQGAPTHIEGDITITPAGSGSTYAISFEVSAKVPLIRKKLEQYISGVTEEGMREEFEYNQRTLDAGS